MIPTEFLLGAAVITAAPQYQVSATCAHDINGSSGRSYDRPLIPALS